MSAAGREPLRLGAFLSLSGRYARFGRQAAAGLGALRSLTEDFELRLEDDGSDPRRLAGGIRRLAAKSDLLLGPYSTRLTRVAAAEVAEMGGILWNHGGAGDDVQGAAPGHVVSVLTPTSRYAEPFVRLLAAARTRGPLWLVAGRGSFGRQVAEGAEALATRLGLEVVKRGPVGGLPPPGTTGIWDLLCAGSFEEDVAAVLEVRAGSSQPRALCAVAAGVHEFGSSVADPAGVYGIAQWFPDSAAQPKLGPAEGDLLAAYSRLAGNEPDYPAVQAAAGAVIAVHCLRTARTVAPDALWRAAASLDTSTLFGRFSIDPASGAQLGHSTVLVRWTEAGPLRAV